MVLFQRGAVRLLDRLLEDPQQQVEDLLAPDETIRSEEENDLIGQFHQLAP